MLRRCALRLPCVYNYYIKEWAYIKHTSLFSRHVAEKSVWHYERSLVTSNIICLNISKRNVKSDTTSDYSSRHQHDNGANNISSKDDSINNNNNDNLELKIEKKINRIQLFIREWGRVSAYDVQQVEMYIKTAGICSTDSGVLLLQCCGDLIPNLHPVKRIELLTTVWETLSNLDTGKGNSITSDHYYTYLTSLAENKCAVSVDDILQDMSERGLTVDDRIYYALLRCTCEAGDIQQSTKLIAKLRDANVPVTQDVFDYIILGKARSGDMKSAESVKSLLKSDLVKYEASTYTVLLKGSSELGLNEKVEYYLKQAAENSPLANSQILDVVKSLAHGNLLQFIPTVLKTGNWPDEVDYQIVNTCTQLIHLGHIDAALSVFLILPQCMPYSPDSQSSLCSFFLKELIATNTPAQKIIEVCKALSEVNDYTFNKATELALLLKQLDLVLDLLKEMCREGLPVKPHYFWPLIISASTEHGEQGVMRILDTMLTMNVRPDFDTMLDYMFPHCDTSDAAETVNKLKNRGLTLVELMTPTIAILLDSLRIRDAIQLCEKYKARLDGTLLAHHLALAYVQKPNVKQIIKLLSIINTETTPGRVLQYVLTQKQFPVKSDNIITLLKALNDANYSVKKDVFDTVTNCQKQYDIPRDMLPRVAIEDALSSGNTKQPKDMTLEDLECHLLELKAKKLNTRGILRKLLQLHCRFGNVDRALEIHQELLAGGFQFSAGMLSSLMQLYASAGKTLEAENCLADLQTRHRDFQIDSFKILDFATVLIASGKYGRAEKLIKDTAVKMGPPKGNTRNCVNLLLSVAEHESPTATKHMFSLLINRYCSLSNIVLGPLVRSYLMKNDLDGAVKEFEDCFKTYKKTPLAYELMLNLAALVQADNSKLKQLERVVEICRKAHTPRNANVMFVVALAECNLEKQLQTVLRTPGFRLHSETLMVRCKRLVEENKSAVLLTLMLALERTNPMEDVQRIASMALDSYVFGDMTAVLSWPTRQSRGVKSLSGLMVLGSRRRSPVRSCRYGHHHQTKDRQGECDGALVLWSQMQEHDIVYTDNFKKKLANLLTNHKRPVPFRI